MNLFELYKQTELEKSIKRYNEAKLLRESFVQDYPIESIQSLTLDQYLIGKSGFGNPNSFCRRLRYELEPVAHMGNVFNNAFGIYINEHNNVELYKTFSKRFGTNYAVAFDYIKSLIIEVLLAADNEDYDFITNCELNSSFKFKLLMVYFPDKFIPVCTKNTLYGYCDCAGLSFSSKDSMVIRNIRLREWKESIPAIADWPNALVMGFCDWLWRSNKVITAKDFIDSYDTTPAKVIDEEISNLGVIGEIKESLVKVRVNQSVFRDRLIKRECKCCLCGVNDPALLVASHIKPWAVSTPNEKVDPNNGLLMCPNHDSLFDKGYITFDTTGNVIISDKLNEINRIFFNISESISVELSDSSQKYMEYHRNYIFDKKLHSN